VRYRVRGIIGARLILGPVTAGALSIATVTTASSATVAAGVSYGGSILTGGFINGLSDPKFI
jgi:hypothetical protein